MRNMKPTTSIYHPSSPESPLPLSVSTLRSSFSPRKINKSSVSFQYTDLGCNAPSVIGRRSRSGGEIKKESFGPTIRVFSNSKTLLNLLGVNVSLLEALPHEQYPCETTVQTSKQVRRGIRCNTQLKTSSPSNQATQSPFKAHKRTKPYQGSVVHVSSSHETAYNSTPLITPLLSLLRSPELLAIQEQHIQALNRGSL